MPIHQLVGLFFEDTDVLMSVCVWPTNCDDLSSCLISNMSISHQSVSCFLYWNLTRRPDPPVTNFPGSIGLKILGFKRSFFFSMIFGPKKTCWLFTQRPKSISRKFLAPKVIQGRIQNGLCGHPFRSLADGAHLVGCFFGWNLTWGWMETHGNQSFSQIFFGTTIHLPTIWPGYQDFDTAISRHASYLALVMDSLISPRGSKRPWENGAVLFPIFPPPRFTLW